MLIKRPLLETIVIKDIAGQNGQTRNVSYLPALSLGCMAEWQNQ